MSDEAVPRILFSRLIDDAGLFPPARLPMSAALGAHERATSGRYAPLVGRFLTPASKLQAAAAALQKPTPLGVIVDTVGANADNAQLVAEATRVGQYGPTTVEVAASTSGDLSEQVTALLAGFRPLPESVELYIECPRGAVAQWPLAIEALGTSRAGGRRVGAKVRCAAAGDTEAPASGELAGFIVACRDARTPFKATAGLHHAVRHTRDDGYERHGFVNLLLACAAALRGAYIDDIEAVLEERDAELLATATLGLGAGEATRVRSELFIAFGCCDPQEPIADLRGLSLLGGL